MSLHYGAILKKYLEDSEIAISHFANKIGLSRQSAYMIFGREKFDSELLEKIKKAGENPPSKNIKL